MTEDESMTLLHALGLRPTERMLAVLGTATSAAGDGARPPVPPAAPPAAAPPPPKAAGSAAKAQASSPVSGVIKMMRGDFFRPKLKVIGSTMVPIVTLRVGEEATVDLSIQNWDAAPPDAQLTWTATATGKAVTVRVAHRNGDGYVTLKGVGLGAGIVRTTVGVKVDGLVLPFEFAPIYASVVSADAVPDSEKSADQGGPVTTATELEHDMSILLLPWLTGATAGIQQFVTNQLSKRLDDLSSGSWTGFFEGLLGNTVCAATVFFPAAGALQLFVVSMAGIGVASVPSIPQKSESAIPEVTVMMNKYVFDFYEQLTPRLRKVAQGIIDQRPGIKRYEAMSLFAQANFVPGSAKFDPTFQRPPTLNLSVIAKRFERKATEMLDKWTDAAEAEKAAKQWEEMKRMSRKQPGEI